MGGQESYVYDVQERLCKKKDRNGIETTYTYNLYGNLLERRSKHPTDTTDLSERYVYTKESFISKGCDRKGNRIPLYLV
jgi:YD repeat-containing protein